MGLSRAGRAPVAGLLGRTLRGQRRLVSLAAVLYMSWQACESLVPVLIGVVIDHAITPHDARALVLAVAGLAALFLVLSLSFRFASRASTRAAEQAEHELRSDVVRAALGPLTPAAGRASGELLSIATSDAGYTARVCVLAPRVCGALVSTAVAAVALLLISLPLGLLVLLGAPVLLVATSRVGAILDHRAENEQRHAAAAAAVATDLVAGLRVLKGIGGERVALARYRSASRRSLEATLRAARAESLYEASTVLLTMLFLALVALVGGRLAAEGAVSVGQLVAAVGLAQFLLGPLWQLSAAGAALARSRASARRLLAVQKNASAPAPTGELPAPLHGALHVRRPGYTFALTPGELVGVVADAGEAGELVDALATTAAGAVLVARHDAWLFGPTVGDAVRTPAADDDTVRAALTAADADEILDALPDGARTRLGERGHTLSGGQRQRLLLARALAADPPVLVLHDPTTAVDAATESLIAGRLRRLRRDRSTLLVTSSPALLDACDRVLVVTDGRVVAEGTHAGLVSSSTAYRELVLA